MRRVPTFRSADTVIWVSSTLLAIILGAIAAYTVSLAATGTSGAESLFREVLALIAVGLALIVLALQGRLVRFFLLSFAAVFFLALAVASHGFTTL